MAKFMMIIHQRPRTWQRLSPEEVQQKIEAYRAWVTKFHTGGRYISGEKLGEDGGRLLRLEGGRVAVVDGPYAEAKEVVGGYLLFRAADYDEALELLRDCPFLQDGMVALRQTDPAGCGGE